MDQHNMEIRRHQYVITLSIVLFILSGCADPSPQKGKSSENGELIIHVFSQLKSQNALPVILENDYGIMIFNVGNEENPIPRYELSSRKTKKITTYQSIDKFKKSLQEIPKGSNIGIYTKCLVPTYYGLNIDMSGLETFIKKTGLKLDEHIHITCTCPES